MKAWKAVAVGSLVGALAAPGLLSAQPQYLSTFVRTYGITNPLYRQRARLNTCKVCHTAIPNRNPYGAAFLKAHKPGVSVTQALKNIQNLDSDRDGFTNIREIRAGTFPGNRNSHP